MKASSGKCNSAQVLPPPSPACPLAWIWLKRWIWPFACTSEIEYECARESIAVHERRRRGRLGLALQARARANDHRLGLLGL
jgi:hypothetical protein